MKSSTWRSSLDTTMRRRSGTPEGRPVNRSPSLGPGKVEGENVAAHALVLRRHHLGVEAPQRIRILARPAAGADVDCAEVSVAGTPDHRMELHAFAEARGVPGRFGEGPAFGEPAG